MRAQRQPSSTNPLRDYFDAGEGPLVHKWLHYFDIYHQWFQAWRDQPVTVLELGVFHGGSLRMWRDYFGGQARIVGVDVDPRCAALADDRIEVHIGDQEDREFLRRLRDEVGPIDIVIDDGGHSMRQQIVTFEELFSAVRAPGLYLVEDTHTSYWEEYGGEHLEPSSFIEYAKGWIDQLHAHHSRDLERLSVTDVTRWVAGLHFYDSVVVLEKREVPDPVVEKRGRPVFPED